MLVHTPHISHHVKVCSLNLQHCKFSFTFQRMSYARAVKAKSVHLLHSAAETELGRKLSASEVRLLDKRFSLNNVENCVEKVKLTNVFDIVYVTVFLYSMGMVQSNSFLCCVKNLTTDVSSPKPQLHEMETA